MKDNEKQIVYNQIKDGHRSIEELSCKHLKEFKTHWMDDNNKAMPPIDFDIKVRDEIRQREIQTATKPLKPIDRSFYG